MEREGEKASSFLPSFSSPGLSKRITPIIFGGRTDGRAFFAQLPPSLCSSFPHRNFDRQLSLSLSLCSLRPSVRPQSGKRTQASGQIGFAGQGSLGRSVGRNKKERRSEGEGEGSIGPPSLPLSPSRNSEVGLRRPPAPVLISEELRFAKLSTNTLFPSSV